MALPNSSGQDEIPTDSEQEEAEVAELRDLRFLLFKISQRNLSPIAAFG